MKRHCFRIVCFFFLCTLCGYGKPFLSHLTIEGRTSPQGIDVITPRFGWVILSNEHDVVQKAYCLVISSDKKGKDILYNSGWKESKQSQWIKPKNFAVKPNTEYYWRVKVRTNKGETPWSDTQKWSSGMLDDDNWHGVWIGIDTLLSEDVPGDDSRCATRYFRKEFQLTKKIRRATIHSSGLGYYSLQINGQRVGTDRLTPAQTEFHKTVVYNTYDVTTMLKEENALAATVQAGYFFELARDFKKIAGIEHSTPRLRAMLVVEYVDGTSEIIATDTTWKMNTDGPLRYSNIYDGEFYDARKEFGEWTQPNYDDSSWQIASEVVAPGGKMRGNLTEPIVVYDIDKPVSISKYDDRYILDFGTNGAGVLRIKLNTAWGDTVKIRHAERLMDQGRQLYTDNLRGADNTAWYVGNGKETVWQTEYTWYGFRYAEITGINDLNAEDIERLLLSDNLSDEGNTFSVQSQKDTILNDIFRAAVRGIRSNYKGMPLDCPQRNERMPWTGDRVTGCLGESYVLNVYPLYTKWLGDIRDCQKKDGAISDVAPAYWLLYNYNVTWPAVLPFATEMLFRQYGDTTALADNFHSSDRWMGYVKEKTMKDSLITYDRYADWCVPPEDLTLVHSKDPSRQTDGKLLSSSYYSYISNLLAKHARLLSLDKDAERYEALAEMVKQTINDTFLINNNTYSNSTVTANLLPLVMKIVPKENEEAVKQTLISTIVDKNKGKQSCGVIGVQWLMRYLSEIGYGDIAYKIASTREYPGLGYMIDQGATTIWELWNGDTANPSMNSGNHVMLLGDLIPWFFERLAGIAPSDDDGAGFLHIIMRPDFSIKDLDGVSATHLSPYGLIGSSWKREGENIVWDVEIPVNTYATLTMPNGSLKELGSGKYSFTTATK